MGTPFKHFSTILLELCVTLAFPVRQTRGEMERVEQTCLTWEAWVGHAYAVLADVCIEHGLEKEETFVPHPAC